MLDFFTKSSTDSAEKNFAWKINSPAVGRAADGHAARNLLPNDGIQPLIFDFFPAQSGAGHAASDVDTHKCREQPVLKGHGKPDGAGLPRMYIRHDADAAAFRAWVVAEHLHLRQGIWINGVCENGRRSISAVYLFHEIPFCIAGRAPFQGAKIPLHGRRGTIKRTALLYA